MSFQKLKTKFNSLNKRKSLQFLIVVILGIIILFATGSSALTYNIFSIPFGNILVWFGLIALQLFAFISVNGFKINKTYIAKVIRLLITLLIFVSISWFGIAYTISGNVNFNFSSTAEGFVGSLKASILYWNILYTLIIGPFVLMITYNLLRFFIKLKKQ